MGEVAASYVSIYPKFSKDFGTAIQSQVSKTTTGAFGQAEKAGAEQGQKTGKRFGDTFKGAVTPILAVASVAAIGKFVNDSVDSFAQLQDATAAASVVFGDSMDIITQQADKAAESFGISKQQAIDASITFGTFGKSAGLAGADLAGFSTKMTALAGDMASFRGTSPEEAIEAIGAAMRGESEPIRKYGVLLDEATLRNRALQLGLIKTTKDALTPQQKVLAAQAEILAQTSDAQGDFMRTSESTANVQKRLAAESADLSAAIGEKLAPAIVEAQKAGIGLIQWATDNQAVLVPLVGALSLAAAGVLGVVAAGKALDALKSAKATIQGLSESFKALSATARTTVLSMGAIGVALTVGAALYGMYAGAQEKAKQGSEDYAAALKSEKGAIGENTQALIVNRLEQEGALKAGQLLGVGSADLVTALTEQGDALVNIRARILDYNSGTREQKDAMTLLLRVIEQEGGALNNARDSYDRVTTATAAAKNATQDAAKASENRTQTLKDELEAVQKLADAQLGARSSTRNLEAAYDAATAAVKKNGRTLDDTTEKGRNNGAALDNIASSAKQAVADLNKIDPSGRKAGASMSEARRRFIAVAQSMGASRSEAVQLANKLGLIKSKKVAVDVNLNSPNIDSFMASLQRRVNANPLYVPARAPRAIARAYGGPLPGMAPHDRADNVLYRGTPGEWVIQKPTARYYGDSIMAALNAGRIPKERLTGYAYGGKVAGESQNFVGGGPVTINHVHGNAYGDSWAALMDRRKQTERRHAMEGAGLL